MEEITLDTGIGLMANSLDYWAEELQSKGIDIDERLAGLLALIEQVTDPKVLALLGEILQNQQQLSDGLHVVQQLPGVVGTTLDSVDSVLGKIQDAGIDIDERLNASLALLDSLTNPKTQQILNRLLSNTELLEQLVDVTEAAPGTVATLVNTMDSAAHRLQEAGIDLDERIHVTVQIFEILTSPKMLKVMKLIDQKHDQLFGVMEKLLASSIISNSSKMVQFAEQACAAVVETNEEGSKPMSGVFGMLKALKDRDVAYTVGWSLGIARRLGRRLQK